jgi:hypothetical protein
VKLLFGTSFPWVPGEADVPVFASGPARGRRRGMRSNVVAPGPQIVEVATDSPRSPGFPVDKRSWQGTPSRTEGA